MERKGIINHIKGVAEECDSYGELTNFRKITEALVRDTVSQGKWFCFCSKANEEQVDIMSIKNDSGEKLGSMLDVFEFNVYRTRVYKYLLHDYMCYYEAPVVKKEANLNGFKNSFNKYIITANIKVVAEWLGISVEEADAQYGRRILDAELDSEDCTYPYLKLWEDKGHVRKVTKPKLDLNLEQSGIRIIPMYALKVGVDTLFDLLSKDTYDVTFLKDSGQRRVINTTFNVDSIIELYNNSKFVNENYDSVYNGNFDTNPSRERGYIRVFELGASVYNNPTRSINFARICSFAKAEPDMSYMYIDLDSVLDSFTEYISSKKFESVDIDEVVSMLDEFEVGTTREHNHVKINSIVSLSTWANSQSTLLSTVFARQLALFMIGNPQWFEGYTGQPKIMNSNLGSDGGSDDGGAIPGEIGDDFNLPFI